MFADSTRESGRHKEPASQSLQVLKSRSNMIETNSFPLLPRINNTQHTIIYILYTQLTRLCNGNGENIECRCCERRLFQGIFDVLLWWDDLLLYIIHWNWTDSYCANFSVMIFFYVCYDTCNLKSFQYSFL